MLDKLVKIANALDQKGLHREADMIDSVLREVTKTASDSASKEGIWDVISKLEKDDDVQGFDFYFLKALTGVSHWATVEPKNGWKAILIEKNTGDELLLTPEIMKKGYDWLWSDNSGIDRNYIYWINELKYGGQYREYSDLLAQIGLFGTVKYPH